MLINKTVASIFLLGLFMTSCKQNKKSVTITEDIHTIAKAPTIKKLPYFNTPDFTATWLPNTNELNEFHKIPAFNFTNQLGEKVTNKTLEGNIYLASFFFTSCPNICLKLTQNMSELQKIYKNDDEFKLISHTVMPSEDTVEVLKDYGERQNINPEKWYLVTGEKEKIYELAREAYFADDLYKQTNDKNRFIHTENLILVDKKSHIRGVYNGTLPIEVERIKRHFTILKNE